MINPIIDYFTLLRPHLPKGYRLLIANETKSSISLINRVLRGNLPDKKGIIVAAYRIANAEIKRINKDDSELILQKNEYHSQLR